MKWVCYRRCGGIWTVLESEAVWKRFWTCSRQIFRDWDKKWKSRSSRLSRNRLRMFFVMRKREGRTSNSRSKEVAPPFQCVMTERESADGWKNYNLKATA